jgi:hypothetical protein|tara:strand:- start:37 stop:192 length:156 start_codon:yes stop_codon:yes gene_type:complete
VEKINKLIMKNEKHPYYDSDRKKQTEEFSLKVIAFCIVGIVILLIVSVILR